MSAGVLLVAGVVISLAVPGCGDDRSAGGSPGATPASGAAVAVVHHGPVQRSAASVVLTAGG